MSTQSFTLPVTYDVEAMKIKLNTKRIRNATIVGVLALIVGMILFWVEEQVYPDYETLNILYIIPFCVIFFGVSYLFSEIREARSERVMATVENYLDFEKLYIDPIVEQHKNYDELYGAYKFKLVAHGEVRFDARIGNSESFAQYVLTLQRNTLTITREEKQEDARSSA